MPISSEYKTSSKESMNFVNLVITSIAIIGLIFLSIPNNVNATEPVVANFNLINLDKSIPAYSDGDTISIKFNIDTDRGGFALNVPVGTANVDNLFENDGLGIDYDGQWVSNKEFVITVIDSTGHDMIIGASFIDPGIISIADAAFPADTWTASSSPLTVINIGGDGCDNECNPPTLGVIGNKRMVENGFSYNGHAANVEFFFTPYPLIKTTTGIYNTAILKIFDDSGPKNIRHVELSFGLAQGHTINERTASIIWNRYFDGTEIVSVYSPTNAIGKVSIKSDEVLCNSYGNFKCLELIITHQFRAPLEFDIVGTNIWDSNRNAWQNYFNHGIDVQGKSLNPSPTHKGIFHGKLFTLTEIDKNLAIDEDGNRWIFEKIWEMENNLNEKIDDEITSHLFDRNHVLFDTYMKGQELLAQHTLNSILVDKIQNIESEEPNTHYSIFLKRSEDVDLQKKIVYEKHLATKTFNQLFDVKQNY